MSKRKKFPSGILLLGPLAILCVYVLGGLTEEVDLFKFPTYRGIAEVTNNGAVWVWNKEGLHTLPDSHVQENLKFVLSWPASKCKNGQDLRVLEDAEGVWAALSCIYSTRDSLVTYLRRDSQEEIFQLPGKQLIIAAVDAGASWAVLDSSLCSKISGRSPEIRCQEVLQVAARYRFGETQSMHRAGDYVWFLSSDGEVFRWDYLKSEAPEVLRFEQEMKSREKSPISHIVKLVEGEDVWILGLVEEGPVIRRVLMRIPDRGRGISEYVDPGLLVNDIYQSGENIFARSKDKLYQWDGSSEAFLELSDDVGFSSSTLGSFWFCSGDTLFRMPDGVGASPVRHDEVPCLPFMAMTESQSRVWIVSHMGLYSILNLSESSQKEQQFTLEFSGVKGGDSFRNDHVKIRDGSVWIVSQNQIHKRIGVGDFRDTGIRTVLYGGYEAFDIGEYSIIQTWEPIDHGDTSSPGNYRLYLYDERGGARRVDFPETSVESGLFGTKWKVIGREWQIKGVRLQGDAIWVVLTGSEPGLVKIPAALAG